MPQKKVEYVEHVTHAKIEGLTNCKKFEIMYFRIEKMMKQKWYKLIGCSVEYKHVGECNQKRKNDLMGCLFGILGSIQTTSCRMCHLLSSSTVTKSDNGKYNNALLEEISVPLLKFRRQLLATSFKNTV